MSLQRTPTRRSPRLNPPVSPSVNFSDSSLLPVGTADLLDIVSTNSEVTFVSTMPPPTTTTPPASTTTTTTSVLLQPNPTTTLQQHVNSGNPPPKSLPSVNGEYRAEMENLREQINSLQSQLLNALSALNAAVANNAASSSSSSNSSSATSSCAGSAQGEQINGLNINMPEFIDNQQQQTSMPLANNLMQPPASSYLSQLLPPPALPTAPSTNSQPQPLFAAPPSYQVQSVQHMPKKMYDLPEFNGTPEDWPLFSTAFEHSTIAYKYNNFENCLRLQKALKGDAKDCVKSLLIHPDNVNAVMEQLKFQYGRPDLLIRCQLQQVRDIPTINENGVEKLISFAVKVQNFAAFLQTANGHQHLSNPTLMDELVQKLPMSKRLEWAQYASALPWPTVLDFSKWINGVANLIRSVQSVNASRPTEIKKKVVLYATDNQQKQSDCPLCRGNHKIFECKKFVAMSVPNRWNEVKKLRLCFSCLGFGHSSRNCRRRKECPIDGCLKKHNKFLHENQKPAEEINATVTSDTSGPSAEPVLSCVSSIREKCDLLFRVLPVILYGPNCVVETFALLDEGSSVTMIDSSLVRQLGLKGRQSNLNLSWYGGKSSQEVAMVVDLHIGGVNKQRKYALKNVYGVSNLKLPTQSFNMDSKKDYGVPIRSYNNVAPMLLIGLDHCHLGLPDEIVPLNEGGPYAANTPLGWIVFGQVSGGQTTPHTCLLVAQPEQNLYDLVASYFETENFGVKALPDIESNDDLRARQLLNDYTVKVAGRYQSRLLWCDDNVVLPDSYSMAFNRLRSIERKMKKNLEFGAAYKSIINDYIKKRYVRKILPNECTNVSPRTWYLPHFGVFNPNKPGKIRLVFDAAATVEGVSLNSKLMKGPQYYKPLPAVLFNFRVGAVAVCGDIKEMFHQILVAPEDRCSQRFLWRDNENQSPDLYEMLVMTFGAACSPCIAHYVKDTNAVEFRDRYPRAVKSILDHHYVDDFVDSFESVSKAIEVAQQVREIHASAGYELRRFTSNSSEVVVALEGNMDKLVNFSADANDLQSTEKILGMYWHPGDDAFKYELKFHRVKDEVIKGIRCPTKRELLSVVMSIFDPMGFLCNYMISAKLLMREVWRHDVRWDEVLPVSLREIWNNWCTELQNVAQVNVPRYYFKNEPPCSLELHTFVDASEDAFGAVSYWRWSESNDTFGVSFIAAKTKCAPLKTMTIPRLELQAAVLGTRLMCTILKEHSLNVARRILWSDSTTVISWICSESRRYKPFVAHRISEILDSTRPADWRWLPTKLNVADETTRMKNNVDFSSDARWFKGPQFLYSNEEDWPEDNTQQNEKSCEEELRPKFSLLVCTNTIIDFNRFSSFLRLKRTMAWVLRIVQRRKKKDTGTNCLTVAELKDAENCLCRLVQEESFANEIEALNSGGSLIKGSDLYTLSPYVDDKKLLRVYGRIGAATWLPLDSRHPIILPPSHKLTELIVAHFHKTMKHQNFEATMGEIRKQFWIPRLRKLLSKIISSCNTCKIRRATPVHPFMGSLPSDRLSPHVRPFSYTGLDYFGPVNITIGRRHEKRWVALFTCLTIRAIHLEVAFDLSTDACILAIRNFINRRGTPVRIRSDNGKNLLESTKWQSNLMRCLTWPKSKMSCPLKASTGSLIVL